MKNYLIDILRYSALTITLLILCLGCSQQYMYWYSNGPCQVLGNDTELWIFMEFDRIAAKKGLIYDAPSVYPVGHFQEVVILNKDGMKRRIEIKTKNNKDGVTFHPNNAIIFFHQEDIYLYKLESMYYIESLFKWHKDKGFFKLMTIKEGDAFLKHNISNSSFYERIQEIKHISEKYGWKIYYKSRQMGDDTFSWENKNISISDIGDDHFYGITILSENPMNDFPIILKYEHKNVMINKREFKKLSREETGHPK